jgi:hypothetical protein
LIENVSGLKTSLELNLKIAKNKSFWLKIFQQ